MMLQTFTCFLVIIQFSYGENSKTTLSCALNSSHQEGVYSAGDLTIGGLVQQHKLHGNYDFNIKEMSDLLYCSILSIRSFVTRMAFIYAIEQVSRDPEMLPNFTLGYRIFDSCGSQLKALHGTLSILSEQVDPVPNYSCQKQRSVLGVIGDESAPASFAIAQLLQVYKYPQISFGAVDPLFSDKMRFPYFYRTVPNENSFFAGITELLRYFGWTWVVIVVSDDDSGEHALQELKKAVAQGGACIELVVMLAVQMHITSTSDMFSLSRATVSSSSQVFILYSSGASIELHFDFLNLSSAPPKIWILSPGMHLYHGSNHFPALKGSLGFSLKAGKIKGFRDFLHGITTARIKDDAMLELMWQDMFQCQLIDRKYEKPFLTRLPLCSGNESIWSLPLGTLEPMNVRLAYSVYTAVYALAHALHGMMSPDGRKDSSCATWDTKQELEPWKVKDKRIVKTMKEISSNITWIPSPGGQVCNNVEFTVKALPLS